MKSIILMMFLFPMLVSAEVKIHENKFDVNTADGESHFWARFYDWSAWVKTPDQQEIGLTTNFVKEAYDNAHERIEAEELEIEDFEAVLKDDEAEALYEFYADREEVDEDDIGRYSGLVTQIKVSVPVNKNIDLNNMTLEEAAALIIQGDEPHLHTKVSGDFVRRFLDPVHSGHRSAVNLGSGQIYLSVINTGDDYYNCGTMNSALVWKSEAEGISSYDGDYRMYALNTVKELSAAEIAKVSSMVDPGAVKVFEQKMIYSSNLVKSGINYISFYNTAEGVKLVVHSVIVATSRVKEVSDIYLNGFSLKGAVSSNISYTDGMAILNDQNVKLGSGFLSCTEGLGQGVGKYVYGLANKIAN